MNHEDVRVTIHRSDSGFPILNLGDQGSITLRVDVGDAGTLRHVELSGNSEGLRSLGALLLGAAATPGYHSHLDSEVTDGKFASAQGYTLTITNTGLPPKRARSQPPPDWAK